LQSYEVNKTSVDLLLQGQTSEIYDDDTKIKFKEFYSFATFREFYMNIKNLTNRFKSKEAQLNNHQQLLNDA
jgi:hypothetical protein